MADRLPGHPEFHKLVDKMKEIHAAKNQDYGNWHPLGNFMEAEGFGVSPFKGVLIRLSDKYTRVKTLSKKADMVGEVKDESIEDTLIDMANYSILAVILFREMRGRSGEAVDLREAAKSLNADMQHSNC